MKRTRTLLAVLVLLSAPSVLALTEAVSFYARNATNQAIVSSGEKRTYLLYVPPTYDRTRPTPLVISMHAAALWPAAQMETSRWNRVADQQGFIVVYPAGTKGDGERIWHVDGSQALARDVRFISELIDTLRTQYNVDTTRIFANGLSNGGGMAFVLSCTMSRRIAAVGLVASAQTLPFDWCPDRRPVPVIAFHGTADPVVKYSGGPSWAFARGFPNFPAFMAEWARRNHCTPIPNDTKVAKDVTRRSYDGCAADVVFYTVRGGGHSWPGGKPLPEWFVGSTSMSIDATKEMWLFYSRHALSLSSTAP